MFGRLVKQAIDLIRKDKIIVIPFVFCYLIQYLIELAVPIELEKLTASVILIHFIGVKWVVESGFKAMTVSMAESLTKEGEINEGSFKRLGDRFMRVLGATGVVLNCILVIAMIIVVIASLGTLFLGIAVIVAIPLLFLMTVLMEFIVIIVLLESVSLKQSFERLKTFMKVNIKACSIIMLCEIALMFFGTFFMLAAQQIPAVGGVILSICIKSVFICLTTLISYGFYKEVTNGSRINVVIGESEVEEKTTD